MPVTFYYIKENCKKNKEITYLFYFYWLFSLFIYIITISEKYKQVFHYLFSFVERNFNDGMNYSKRIFWKYRLHNIRGAKCWERKAEKSPFQITIVTIEVCEKRGRTPQNTVNTRKWLQYRSIRSTFSVEETCFSKKKIRVNELDRSLTQNFRWYETVLFLSALSQT